MQVADVRRNVPEYLGQSFLLCSGDSPTVSAPVISPFWEEPDIAQVHSQEVSKKVLGLCV